MSGQRNYRRVIQRIGRALRPKPGDNKTLIIDFMDHTHFYLTAQSRARIKVYEHDNYRYEVHRGINSLYSILQEKVNSNEKI
jgi:superfamily II DNA or RNA helicase